MIQVVAIHVPDHKDGEHEITEIKLKNGCTRSVRRTVKDIDTGGVKYHYVLQENKARIITVANFNQTEKHIATNDEDKKGNNLLELRRY